VRASVLLYSQAVDGQSTFGPSELWIPNIDSEVADDFDVAGNIDRVVANGFASPGTTFQGSIFGSMSICRTAHPVRCNRGTF